jgi:LPXTG-motif cell wall-anchored protein
MDTLNKVARSLGLAAAGAVVFGLMAFGTWGQDTTATTVQHGDASFDTEVRNAEVAYVEGNDLVLKLESGKVEHLVVPDSDTFTIDGKDVSVHELTAGTKLTQTITTSTAPRYVNTVRTLKGKVWHVNPVGSSVILSLPDNTNHLYKIPNHAKLVINGQQKSVSDLKKGMQIEVTIVTDDTHTVTEQTKSVAGMAPAAPIATPAERGLLLIYVPQSAPRFQASAEQPEELASALPKTGSSLPLLGMLGGLVMATSLGVGAVRRSLKA